jgi:RNA polymerase sigma factor (sigma-70 family)
MPIALNIARKYAKNKVDLEDYTQEFLLAHLKLKQKLKKLPDENLLKLSIISGRNHVLDLLKSKRVIASHHIPLDEELEVAEPDKIKEVELRDTLRRVEESLPIEKKKIFFRLYRGDNVREIARGEGISMRTVYRCIFRIRKELSSN